MVTKFNVDDCKLISVQKQNCEFIEVLQLHGELILPVHSTGYSYVHASAVYNVLKNTARKNTKLMYFISQMGIKRILMK